MSKYQSKDWRRAALDTKRLLWEKTALEWFRASVTTSHQPRIDTADCVYCIKFGKITTDGSINCTKCPLFRPVQKNGKAYFCADTTYTDKKKVQKTWVSEYQDYYTTRVKVAARIYKKIISSKTKHFPELC